MQHGRLVASKNAGQTLLNTWIEFSNRLLNFPLVVIAALVFIAAWRFRPQARARAAPRPVLARARPSRPASWRRR